MNKSQLGSLGQSVQMPKGILKKGHEAVSDGGRLKVMEGLEGLDKGVTGSWSKAMKRGVKVP